MTELEIITSLSDTLNVIDYVEVFGPQAKDLLFYLISTIVGIVFTVMLVKSSKFSNFLYANGGLPEKLKYKKTPYENLDQPILDKSSLDNIINRISNNYRILVTIYGILLAFVVSDKISLIFSSWAFMIWTGWVLGVIIKAGWHLWEMSDLIERKSDLIDISRDIYNQKEFFKHMMILLAIAIAFLPSVIYFHDDLFNPDTLPWGNSATAFIGAFGVLSITFLFFMILHLYRFVDEGGSLSVYSYVGSLFLLFFLSGFNDSPLEPQLVTLGGIIDGKIPTLFVSALVLVGGLGSYPLFIISRMIFKKLKKSKIR
ncbi:MAG: hypothetical protein WD717_01245 [Nitrosarchaeum sp.]